ncbi:transcription factor IIA, alpha/beta subunit [Chaetomium strumarium]|uniref:Transcription initiation factor IIA large subunit n=1 Tax=Chaetomium strumarium TaxID=1170767 RepID=A0AAJ0H1S8_9PEZI|nr:transcription factor IIA, alpha/beta subunit [Chaetomium strumarium]
MSNVAVGPVYDTIISEVINAVRVDFEENGVEEGVLEDLKKSWQAKLSQMKVAQFPWEPKQEPQPAAAPANNGPATTAAPSAAPATANHTQPTMSPQGAAQTLSLPGAMLANHNNNNHNNGVALKQDPGLVDTEPVIKQEPGTGMPPVHPAYNPASATPTAAQRAALALQSQYGQRAAASINAIQSVMVPQTNGNAQAQQGTRQGQAPQHMSPQQQYRQGVAAVVQQRMQQVSQAGATNSLPNAQYDGSNDAAEGASLPQGCGSGQPPIMDRERIDQHFHAQLAARAKQMEGGGLMVPLNDAAKQPSLVAPRQGDGPAQLDGGDDDIKSEEDEDAINSDLDDTDEDKDDDDDDDETMGHMMLCMYDKVQRVKNKWKCILKDGVLTVNGKEYVFHKATGEYEW